MSADNRDIFSRELGVAPVRLQAADVSPIRRDRLYWCNWDVAPLTPQEATAQAFLSDRGYFPFEKFYSLTAAGGRTQYLPGSEWKYFHRFATWSQNYIFLSREHFDECARTYHQEINPARSFSQAGLCGDGYRCFDGIRKLTISELETLHGLPVGYIGPMKYYRAHDLIGDGWHIDVITHIFGALKKHLEQKVG